MFTFSCPLQWTWILLWSHLEIRSDVSDTLEDVACFHNEMFSVTHTDTQITHAPQLIKSSIFANIHIHTHTVSNQTGVKWQGPYSCCCAVHWYANWQASPLEATITLAFLPVRHMSWGQRTCVIDWVCLIVVPSLFTRVLIYDRRREGGRSFGRWRAGNRAINHRALRAPTSWLPASQSN